MSYQENLDRAVDKMRSISDKLDADFYSGNDVRFAVDMGAFIASYNFVDEALQKGYVPKQWQNSIMNRDEC